MHRTKTILIRFEKKKKQFQPLLLPASVAPLQQNDEVEILGEPSTPPKLKLIQV